MIVMASKEWRTGAEPYNDRAGVGDMAVRRGDRPVVETLAPGHLSRPAVYALLVLVTLILGLNWPIMATGVVAIVRLNDYSSAVDLVKALGEGGIDVVEFTYTNPRAGAAVEEVKAALGDAVLAGAGTVLDPETCRAAILQGADFIVTPTVQVDTIRLCQRYSVPSVIGP